MMSTGQHRIPSPVISILTSAFHPIIRRSYDSRHSLGIGNTSVDHVAIRSIDSLFFEAYIAQCHNDDLLVLNDHMWLLSFMSEIMREIRYCYYKDSARFDINTVKERFFPMLAETALVGMPCCDDCNCLWNTNWQSCDLTCAHREIEVKSKKGVGNFTQFDGGIYAGVADRIKASNPKDFCLVTLTCDGYNVSSNTNRDFTITPTKNLTRHNPGTATRPNKDVKYRFNVYRRTNLHDPSVYGSEFLRVRLISLNRNKDRIVSFLANFFTAFAHSVHPITSRQRWDRVENKMFPSGRVWREVHDSFELFLTYAPRRGRYGEGVR